MNTRQLPIPNHFEPQKVGEVWRVAYQERAAMAAIWAKQHKLQPVAQDQIQTCLLLVDVQNTFCIPEFELFVGGRSGKGAVDDNLRLCEFIYHNLGLITAIIPTLDTHSAIQIFHPVFWVDPSGEHPEPYTLISVDDVKNGVWQVNASIAESLAKQTQLDLQQYALYYTQRLSEGGKYPLTVWPYHAMLGGIGHALVSAVEEALFFHCIARNSQTRFEQKGSHPLTEHYSALGPEVLEGPNGQPFIQQNSALIQKLLEFDVVIIAGQAKSHCVTWTVDDLLTEIQAQDPSFANKVYLLEDCTSPVVAPEVDYTEQADAAFQRFATAGMHVVRSTDPIHSWPGIPL